MITVSDLGLACSGQPLFSHVDLQFTKDNCYDIIGANGADKSTFLKILSGELEPIPGKVSILPKTRISVLKQDQNAYDTYNVMDTVITGNRRLYDIGEEKEALYTKEEMIEADGIRACELEEEYAELGGWGAENDASRILQDLGMGTEFHSNDMVTLDARLEVRVLLAQTLLDNPNILLLDESTGNLGINAMNQLKDFLLDFEGTVIMVSHDRYFLNTICTRIVDIDYNRIEIYVGNYNLWYDVSQLMQDLTENQNKRDKEEAQELKEFISRFFVNKSRSKQATARCKLLEEITLEKIPVSSCRYPWAAFSPDQEMGKDILFAAGINKTIDGVKVLGKVSFTVDHGDKIAFMDDNENTRAALFQILTDELGSDEGTVKWGQTATFSYFPRDNTKFFKDHDDNLVGQLRQWFSDLHETYLQGFLDRTLFSGDEVYKPIRVLSDGEKVRCVLSRMVLSGTNVLLFDQPASHLDLEFITALNSGLEAVKCNVLFASHDHRLMQTVANRVFDFASDDKLIDHKMTYDRYLENQKAN